MSDPKKLMHISVDGMTAKRNYNLFMRLLSEAIKLAPSNVTFTSPDIIKLQSKLDIYEKALETVRGLTFSWVVAEQTVN